MNNGCHSCRLWHMYLFVWFPFLPCRGVPWSHQSGTADWHTQHHCWRWCKSNTLLCLFLDSVLSSVWLYLAVHPSSHTIPMLRIFTSNCPNPLVELSMMKSWIQMRSVLPSLSLLYCSGDVASFGNFIQQCCNDIHSALATCIAEFYLHWSVLEPLTTHTHTPLTFSYRASFVALPF